MTLKDIAKEAGVSISTVSRIINGNSSNAASKEMQDKIWSMHEPADMCLTLPPRH